jgi:NAD(P)-dependent dehydrogenase (short-subunit alcohol dehydrogenase family)
MSAATPARRGAALVTGGNRGIGRAICLELASKGFSVAFTDIVDEADAQETLSAVREKGSALYIRNDVSDTASHMALVESVEAALGPVACLINNAGQQVAVRGDLLEVTEEAFDRLIAVNLRGTFFLTQAVARAMVRQATLAAHRSIITITSANAGLVSPEKGAYGPSKAGLSMAMQQYAVRLADEGIAVHEIRPGLIRTAMTAAVFEPYSRRVERGEISPVRRWGEPEEIARGVAALATGALPFSTGDIFNIGGGMHIHRL